MPGTLSAFDLVLYGTTEQDWPPGTTLPPSTTPLSTEAVASSSHATTSTTTLADAHASQNTQTKKVHDEVSDHAETYP